MAHPAVHCCQICSFCRFPAASGAVTDYTAAAGQSAQPPAYSSIRPSSPATTSAAGPATNSFEGNISKYCCSSSRLSSVRRLWSVYRGQTVCHTTVVAATGCSYVPAVQRPSRLHWLSHCYNVCQNRALNPCPRLVFDETASRLFSQAYAMIIDVSWL